MSPTAAPTASVTIAVCTFRREHLLDTLLSLGAIERPHGCTVDIVVADNDAVPSARPLVEEAKQTVAFEIRYVHAPAANISIARNACLDHARARHVAFVDDDELVGPGWLAALLETARETKADAVLGPVRAVYGADAPGWMRDGDFHSTLPVFVGGRILTGYTCNVLLDRGSDALRGLRFDHARGRSGGEDTAFFHEVTARGGVISFCPQAEISEAVPSQRASLRWLARRRYRMGQTHGQIVAAGRGPAGRLGAAATAGAKLLACLGLAARHLPDPILWRRNLLRAVLHAGAVAGVLGARAVEIYGGRPRGERGELDAA